MANSKSSTAAVHTQEGFRIPIKITLTEKLLGDLLVAREALSGAEGRSPEADALDKALLTITIPGHLQPQLVRRMGAVLGGAFGGDDIPGAALLMCKLTEDEQFSYDQMRKLVSGERIAEMFA